MGQRRLALSVSSATVDAKASGSSAPSFEGQLDHIESLMHSLPDDLTLDQKYCGKEFIRARANVFSRSELDIKHVNSRPCSLDTEPQLMPFQQLLDAAAVARRFTDMSMYGLSGSCDS